MSDTKKRPTLEELREAAVPVRPIFVKVVLKTEVLVLAETKADAKETAFDVESDAWTFDSGETLSEAAALRNPQWREAEPVFAPRIQQVFGDLIGCTTENIIQTLKKEKPNRCPYTLDMFEDEEASQ